MKPRNEDFHDPQATLPPCEPELSRRIVVSEPDQNESERKSNRRRLRLGTPRTQAAEPDSPVNPFVQRGFRLGGADSLADELSANGDRPIVQRWILFVAGGAVILLILALVLRPSVGAKAEAAAHDRLLRQYVQYLETKRTQNSIDINVRRKEVVGRLQAIAWAKAVGDRAALENELRALLFLDNDKASPLYQYSVSELKRLGSTRRISGL